ncbi:MAG: glycosyl hydrolase [Bacteroidetes bacterium]|nr:MAG: glycosyl hydrolase [Bacteroidota bacterium]
MKYLLLSFLSLVVVFSGQAQGMPSLVTPAEQRLAATAQRQALLAESLVGGLPFKNIGPSIQSGRVSDLAVDPTDPTHFFVAYASGGLWETNNNGTTFTPVFDNADVLTLGALAVDWNNKVLWAGTGEVNSSRSSYAGLGMYRSADGGKTWQQRGLTESHHIARILLHPTDPNTLWVAVLGHLYSPNGQRGIYKTTDGGATWEKTLFVNNDAGGIELVLDPRNANHLYAATWERSRRAWNFVEAGFGSGIYESNDGGDNWELITSEKSGFPNGENTGRIGLALTYDGDQPLLYASVDNYNRRPAEPTKTEELTKAQLKTMSSVDFANLKKPLLRDFLQRNGFPKEYDVEKVKAMVASGEISPQTLVEYTESANSLLFDTEVIGLEVYKLNRNGRKWSKTHEGYLDGVYYSYGYYFGTIRVSATDPQRLYVLGVPVLRSDDGGATWRGINAENVHSDHHALWSDPNRPGHLILGNDGGINISYDDGENWIKCNDPALGQFYYVAVDMAEPYRVYGGLQDNGVWMGEHTYEASPRWQQNGEYGYKMIGGGDGMQVAVDCRDNETVYAGSQFGNYFRMNTRTGDRNYITPQHKLGERPFRWNWQTPIHLSVHNPDILYMGSNYFHRSLNQGKDFVKISNDLTNGGQPGDVPYGTLSAIHESPLQFGLLYAGSDDGLVHISQDGGYSWQNISAGLPPDFWVSRIQASQYEEGRVYLALNGYRWDNWNAMLYRSDDYGQTWEIIGRNLPQEPINVVKEDPTNEQLIYVGTDHGAYVSLDQGVNFQAFRTGLPGAPVHDIVVHPRDNDIIIGTHGRSLYLASARELQAMTPAVMASQVQLFKLENTRRGRSWGGQSWTRDNAPEMNLPVYAQAAGRATVTISAADGPLLTTFSADLKAGLQYLTYDFTYTKDAWPGYRKMLESKLKEDDSLPDMEPADDGKYYLQKGKFTVTVELGGSKSEQSFEIK